MLTALPLRSIDFSESSLKTIWEKAWEKISVKSSVRVLDMEGGLNTKIKRNKRPKDVDHCVILGTNFRQKMNLDILYQLFLHSTGVSTDTRKINPGNLFFALKGPSFNANDFAAKALELGASAVVIDEAAYFVEGDERYFICEDVLATLQQLANYHRRRLDIPVIGLTGSNGKTTSKELLDRKSVV